MSHSRLTGVRRRPSDTAGAVRPRVRHRHEHIAQRLWQGVLHWLHQLQPAHVFSGRQLLCAPTAAGLDLNPCSASTLAHRDFASYGVAYELAALDQPLTETQIRQLVEDAGEQLGDPNAIRSVRQIRI